MKGMKDMSPKEQGEMIEKLKGSCACPGCPSYNSCAKNAKELLFCAIGKSFMCISENKGCNCPSCPVTGQLGLKYSSFCTRSSEKALRYENAIWGTKMG